MRRLRLRPEARLELEFAADWYENPVTGLGGEFILAADQLFDSLGDLHHRFPVHRGEIRRAELPRFPHYIYFTLSTEFIEILAVIHPSRNPSFIRKRLK
jgi:toxin ParE1/3/4